MNCPSLILLLALILWNSPCLLPSLISFQIRSAFRYRLVWNHVQTIEDHLVSVAINWDRNSPTLVIVISLVPWDIQLILSSRQCCNQLTNFHFPLIFRTLILWRTRRNSDYFGIFQNRMLFLISSHFNSTFELSESDNLDTSFLLIFTFPLPSSYALLLLFDRWCWR
jgi:hypothetical protein